MAIIYGGGMTTAGGGTGGAFQDATTSIKGIVRLATLAETQNGTSQSIATTPAGVKQVINDLIGGAPEILDTLKEIADAIGNDPNFATRLATAESDIQDIAQSVDILQQEVDATQVGAGLSAAGAYLVDLATNYIANATSLSDADKKLDAKLKELFDQLNAGLGLSAGEVLFTANGDSTDGDTKFRFIGLGALPDRTLVLGSTPNYPTTVNTSITTTENYNGTHAALTAQNLNANGSTNIYLKDNTASETSGFAVLGMNNSAYNSGSNLVGERAKALYVGNANGDIALMANFNGDVRGGAIHLGFQGGEKAVSVLNSGALSIGTTFNTTTQNYVPVAGNAGDLLTSGGANEQLQWTSQEDILLDVNTQLDALDTSIGSVNGVIGNFATSSVITAASSVKSAIEALDTYLGTMEGGNGIIALQSEVDAIESSTGLNANGSKPNYSSTNFIANADSHNTAIGKLDSRANTNASNISALQTSVTNIEADITALQQYDLNASTSLGLGLDGGKVNFESSNVINPAGTFKAAIEALDAEIVNINGDIGARALQEELDATQTGAGLNANGSWTPPVGSNYMGASTTIKGALTALDTGLNSVANSLAGEIVNRQNADDALTQDILDEASARALADGGLQSELDATQLGAGLNIDGTWTPPNDTQFLGASVSIKNALDLLDQNLATVYNDFDIHHLHSNSYYVNDGISDIQTVHDLADFGQGDVIYVSSGSYGGADLALTKQNFAITCPDVPSGSAICELAGGRGITISGATCTRVRISNLQVEGNLTITGTEGRHLFKNVAFLGTVTISNTPNFIVFENCDFVGAISVSGTATIYFNRCNLNGAFITSTKASPLLTILTECTGVATTQGNLTSNVALVGRTGVNTTPASVVNYLNSSRYVYDLATGATTSFSGSYSELRNKPTIPTASTQLTDSASLVRTTDAGTVFPPLSAGVIPSQYLPSFVFAQVHLVADAAALANLPNIHTLVEGDVAIQQDTGESWIWDGTQFQALGAAGSGIQEVNNKSGVSVTLVTDDIQEDANPANLWFTDARALSASVTSNIDTDNKAPTTQAVKSYVSSNYVLSSDYEDLDVLAKIKNVDGTGSGLDADLLDGLNSNQFVQTSGAQTVAGVKTFSDSPVVPTVAQLDGSTKAASTAYVDTAITNVGGNFSNSGALIYKGTFDASGAATPLANAKVGYFYAISAAGSLAGVNLNTTDQIIFVADVAGGTVVATDFIVVDNTESPVSVGNLPVVVFGGGQLNKGIYHLVNTNSNITCSVPTKAMVNGKTGDVFYIRHRGAGTVTVNAGGIAGGEFLWYNDPGIPPGNAGATFGTKQVVLTKAGEYKFVATQIDGAASSFVQWDITVSSQRALRTTDDMPEGSTNLYHSTARARSAISATAPIVYNSTTGVISTTLTAFTAEEAQDAVNTMLTNGTHSGISYSYNDGSNALSSTVAITGEALAWTTVALNTGTTAGVVGNYYYTSTTLQGTAYTVTPPATGRNGDIIYIHNLGGNTVNFGTTAYYYNGAYSGVGATFTSTENDVFVFTRFGTGNAWFISKQVSHNRYAAEDAVDAVGAALVAGTNTGIQFTYGATQDSANRIDATVSLAGFSTTNLSEGTNLYYTQERAEDAVNTLLSAGSHTGITYSYTDNGTGAGALSSTVSLAGFSTTDLAEGTRLYHTQERVEDAVNTLLTAGAPHTGISYTYTDNGTGAGALTSTVSLAGFSVNALSDVDTSTAAIGDVLTWNGTNWVGNAAGGGGGSSYTYTHVHTTSNSYDIPWDDPLAIANETIITMIPTANATIYLPVPSSHVGSRDLRGVKVIIKNLSAYQLTIASSAGGTSIWYDGATKQANVVIPVNNIGFSTTFVLVKTGTTNSDLAWAAI